MKLFLCEKLRVSIVATAIECSSAIKLRSVPFQVVEFKAAAVIPYVPLGKRFCRHNVKRVLLGESGCRSGEEARGESKSSVFSSGQLSVGEAIRSRVFIDFSNRLKNL
ncbi:hypothetical protein GQX74_007679 [Glossina fuscipes]|nr:hypothetical protein GQX74_007679 [Glossina fuscipes]